MLMMGEAAPMSCGDVLMSAQHGPKTQPEKRETTCLVDGDLGAGTDRVALGCLELLQGDMNTWNRAPKKKRKKPTLTEKLRRRGASPSRGTMPISSGLPRFMATTSFG
jgi:hypothetical protein